MEIRELVDTIVIVATIINTVWITFKSYKELRPSLSRMETDEDKTEAEIESELASAAEITAKGATVSSTLLMERIKELREDLENEKRARREDAAYFRRRFREAEREARDYRIWAAKLAKQVIEAGKIPVEFVQTFGDTEEGIAPIKDSRRRDDKPSNGNK